MTKKINAKILCSTKNMDRKEWLKMRQKGLGGSDIGAICGVNKYKSSISVYLDKTRNPEELEESQSESAYWGTQLEDLVAKEFSKKEPKFKIKKQNKIFQHPQYEFMLANIDRLIYCEERGYGILECKTVSEYLKDGWTDDNVPDSYYLQVQHYLYVLGLDYAYIAALIGGNKYQYKLIERNEELIEQLVEIECNFWKLVKEKTPPSADGSDDYSKYLSSLYSKSEDGVVVELPHLSKTLEEIDRIEEQLELLGKQKEQLKQKIQEEMKNAEIAYIVTEEKKRKITWKTQISSRVDTKTLKAEQPDLYSKYTKTIESRVFKIS